MMMGTPLIPAVATGIRRSGCREGGFSVSIRIMSWLWEESPSEGVELLIELALADFANDQGECWPSNASITKKARCSERYVRDVIGALVESGRLKVDYRAGPHHVNLYTFIGAPGAPKKSGDRGIPGLPIGAF